MAIDRQLEAETVIRFDETGEPAKLWTAVGRVAQEWRSYGFPVKQWAQGGWYAEVPVDRISYRTMSQKGSPAENSPKRVENRRKSEPKTDDLVVGRVQGSRAHNGE